MHKAALTVGVFDMLHEGHVNLLKEMQAKAEQVYVIVHDDYSTFLNKHRFPVQGLSHRIANLKQLRIATEIISCVVADPGPVLDNMIVVLQQLGSVVYVRGDDWEHFPGKSVLDQHGIPIEYIPYTTGISSSQRRDEL